RRHYEEPILVDRCERSGGRGNSRAHFATGEPGQGGRVDARRAAEAGLCRAAPSGERPAAHPYHHARRGRTPGNRTAAGVPGGIVVPDGARRTKQAVGCSAWYDEISP